MTRETKIGLLVGLAFIIVIGILLSDYKTATSEPAPAPLQLTGNNVRSGVGTPTDADVNPVAVVPPDVTPNQPVPTHDEVVAQVTRRRLPVAVVDDNSVTRVPTALAEAANKIGEPIVPAQSPIVTVGNQTATAVTDAPAASGSRSYTVQPGDSLSQIAYKTMGTSSRAAQAAIVALNPSLQANPNLIFVGKTYQVPAKGARSTSAKAPVIQTVASARRTVREQPSATPIHIYVVQSGDSLWSIAVNQLGSPSTIPAIKAINKDVLRGSDQVRVNMKLRLPAKPLASAE